MFSKYLTILVFAWRAPVYLLISTTELFNIRQEVDVFIELPVFQVPVWKRSIFLLQFSKYNDKLV